VMMFHCIGDGGFGSDAQCIYGQFGTVWCVSCRDRDALKLISGLFWGAVGLTPFCWARLHGFCMILQVAGLMLLSLVPIFGS